MQIVQGEDVPFVDRIHSHRKGSFRFRRVLEGQPGMIDNYSFLIVHTIDDFFSPRHRHAFDQYRYQLEGNFDFARDGTMRPGVLGYFPEGTFYGPQSSKESCLTAVLQFGSASGTGFLSQREVEGATAELKKYGRFEDGVFKRNEDVEGKRNMDGWQAIWEFLNKRPMVFPQPRYSVPVMMDKASYRWVPCGDAPGVYEKAMGVFTEFRAAVGHVKLDPGATFRARGRGVYLALSGAGTLEDQPLRRYTAVYLAAGEHATFRANETTEILRYGLPDLSSLKREAPAAQAAE